MKALAGLALLYGIYKFFTIQIGMLYYEDVVRLSDYHVLLAIMVILAIGIMVQGKTATKKPVAKKEPDPEREGWFPKPKGSS